MFHKAKKVSPKENYVIKVSFEGGKDKKYDLKPLFQEFPCFQSLKEIEGLYENVRIDVGGYGIVWNDDIDLSAEEVWNNGVEV